MVTPGEFSHAAAKHLLNLTMQPLRFMELSLQDPLLSFVTSNVP